MRKLALVTVLGLFTVALLSVPMVSQADTPEVGSAADNPAAFISKDFGCGMFDGDGGFVLTFDGNLSVVTSSNHTTLICKAKGQANSTGSAVVTRGFGCNTSLGFTTDSQNIVSASGNITLRCRI